MEHGLSINKLEPSESDFNPLKHPWAAFHGLELPQPINTALGFPQYH